MDASTLAVARAATLIVPGLVAGFIDSIAGGGGLVSLPVMTLVLGLGPAAIGTNKVVGTTAALVALAVYLRGGHLDWRRSLAFAAWVGLGSWAGSLTAPHVSLAVFWWLLMAGCPALLYIILRKDLWVVREAAATTAAAPGTWLAVAAWGLACGFYDGLWGPGGGTFMFLALLFCVRLPLLPALAAAKLANACSAGTALASFAAAGYVHWGEGTLMAAGVAVGAFLGARQATQRAARVVRPALAIVVTLLLLRLLAA